MPHRSVCGVRVGSVGGGSGGGGSGSCEFLSHRGPKHEDAYSGALSNRQTPGGAREGRRCHGPRGHVTTLFSGGFQAVGFLCRLWLWASIIKNPEHHAELFHIIRARVELCREDQPKGALRGQVQHCERDSAVSRLVRGRPVAREQLQEVQCSETPANSIMTGTEPRSANCIGVQYHLVGKLGAHLELFLDRRSPTASNI